MKKYIGSPLNIDRNIIGRVTHNFSFGKKDNVLVSKRIPRINWGFKAIISRVDRGDNGNKKKYPIINDLKQIDDLKNGDIVLISPKGEVVILYEKESQENALIITNKCNCSCVMCPQCENDENGSFLEINLKLISLMDKNMKFLGLTGGEPTIKRDDLLKVIKICKKKLPNTSLELLTNGILLEDIDYVKELVSIKHPNLFFQIPLYSDIDTIHNEIMGREGFFKTIKGLYNLAFYKQKVEIRNVILALNYKRLHNFAEFIYRNFPFVYHIAFMGMECVGKAKENFKDLWVNPIYYANQLQGAVKFLYRTDLDVSIYNHPLCLISKDLWRFARKSISHWKNKYFDICSQCDLRHDCGGFFSSSLEEVFGNHIKPITL